MGILYFSKLIQKLLGGGADRNACDGSRQTLLHHALFESSIPAKTVAVLVARKANFRAPTIYGPRARNKIKHGYWTPRKGLEGWNRLKMEMAVRLCTLAAILECSHDGLWLERVDLRGV